MEQNSERGTEQNTKEQMHKNMGINIISNKLIRPIGRSRGVKDLKLLREPFIEDVYEEEATQPEMRLQQMVEEVATSFNGERIEEEIRVLKKKITDKAEALKRNRSFGEDLLRNLDEEEAEIRSNMERQISFVKRRRQNIQNILDSQKKEEDECNKLLKNILI
nr:PREDICTED: uncharacterized protein LOC103312964 [Tribolium castaneum]XP_015840421.1 PREDICTED: uncharacterized protein LOC103312964 [Tribolium castaneum]|eukprot:XP_015840420.1 PREDICTED: uncharacterized protein LOC103312964 [Tribolium castaneum]